MAALTMAALQPRSLLAAAAVVLLLGALPTPAEAQTVTVTNTNDSGAGSLRDAIAAVNGGTATAINMNGLAGTITLVTPLPTIVNSVTIIGAGAGLSIEGDGAAEVLLNTGANVTIADFVVGDALTKEGTSTLSWGGTSQAYTGDTAINAGGLRLLTSDLLSPGSAMYVAPDAVLDLNGTTQSVGDLAVDADGLVDLGSGVLTITGDALTGSVVWGTIAGDGGSLHVTGDATLQVDGFLGGQGTYTGTTRVSGNAYVGLFGDQVLSAQSGLLLEDDAFLEIDGANTFASLSGTGGQLFLCDCTSVTIDQAVDTTFAGALSGDAPSTFTKAGAGRLYLTGDSSLFLGTMSVTGGTLAGTTGSLTTTIFNTATVEFDQSVDGDFVGQIFASGAVVKSGTGAVTFLATNGYTGGTVVNAGTLIAAADGALGDGSLTMNGGTLQVDAFVGVTSLAGAAGTIEINDTLDIDQDIDTTFGGMLAGSGSLEKYGDGMLTLTGASSFSGEVDVEEGILALGGAGALTAAEFIEIEDGAELRLLSDQTLNDFDVLSGGTLAVGTHTLTVNSGSFGSFLTGNVTGTGAIVVDGVSGVAFTGESDFSGSLTLQGNSSSALLVDNAIASVSSVTINDNAYLEIEGVQRFGSLSGNGGEIFLCDCASLTVDQDVDTTFAGALSADPDATFTKAGAGRLMLTGDVSTFFGAMAVSGGILAGTTSSLRGDILNDATVEFDQDFSGTWSDIISGSGSLVKSGSGTVLLDGFNTYTGGTIVNEGRLHAFGSNVIGSGGLTVNGGEFFLDAGSQTVSSLSGSGGTVWLDSTSVLTIDQASNTTYAGQITDAGSLVKTGSGALTLTGTNSYTGGTTVAGGMLIGTVNSLQGDIQNDATVQFDQSAVEGTYAGDMSGTGALLVTGGGTLTLTGTNSYSGGTTVMEGTLEGTTSSLQGDISNSGTVVFNQSTYDSFDGTISGTGALVKSGTGSVSLTAANTFTGGTTVNAGWLTVGADGALGLGALTINGGTLNVDAEQEISSLAGEGGTLYVGGLLGIDQAGDTTYSGQIAGFGGIEKTGAGTLTVVGSGLFQGEVTVTGGTLAIGGTNLLSEDGFFDVGTAGTLLMLSDQTFGAMSIEGTLAVGANTLTVQAGALGALVSGNVTGNGAIVVGGTTDFIIGSRLDFSGSVTFGEDSTSALLGDNALAGASSVTINDNAFLEVEGTQTFAALAGSGGELFLCDCAALTVDQAVNTTFAGALAGEAGALFIKDGSGRLTLTGDGSGFLGTLVVAGGVLEGSTFSLTSDIVNNAVVEFNQASDGTYAGAMSGDGMLVKSGGGALTLLGTNSHTGGTTIDGGTLLVGSDASLGSASGALTIENGTFGILAGFASARDVILAGDGTIDTGDSQLVLSGALTGGGGLTKIGSGQLWLTGSASHSGGTRVLEGLLGGDTATLQGGIVNRAVVVFDQAFDGTFDGVISGTGQVAKFGDGQLTIADAQTYTGETIVAEGGLRLDGSLAGPVVVFEGATFSGSGTVAGEVLVAGTFTAGTLPGGAGGGGENGAGAHAVIPPMTIQGNLLLTSGAVYQAQVDEDASIATLQVGGLALVEGATLQLFETAAGIDVDARRSSSTVLTASQIIGSFGSVTGLDGAFDPYFFVSDDALELLLVRTDVDFAAFASSANGSEVGAALAAAAPGASGDLKFVTRELSALETDAELAAALDRLSGAAHASVAGIGLIATADAIDVLTSRFEGRAGWWLQALGSNLSLESRVDPLASSAELRGAMAGYDRAFGRVRAGVAGGYQDTGIDATGGLDRIDGRAIRGAAYGEYRAGRFFVDAVAGFASHAIRGSRGIDFAARLDPEFGGGLLFGGVSRSAAFDYDATELTAVADAGYGFAIGPLTLQPAAGVQVTRFAREGFAESGAGSLDLTAGESTVSSTAARARLSLERRVDRAAPRWFAPRASVRYTHALGDRAVPFTAAIAGEPFTAHGFALPESLLAAKAGFAAGMGRVSFSLDYRAAFAAGHRHHLISAGFGF